MYKPILGEKWHLKSDKNKVLTVQWCNSEDYVCFSAPWMKSSFGRVESLKTFHKRYARQPDFYADQIDSEIARLNSLPPLKDGAQ